MNDDEIMAQVVGADIVKKLKPIKDIQLQIQMIEREISDEKKRSQKKLAELDKKLSEIRDKCKHEATKQQVGSGNNDNWVQCLICGYQVDSDSSAGYSG